MPLAITLAVFFIRASIMRRGLVKNLYQTMRMEVSEQLQQVAAAWIRLDIVGLEVAGNLVLGCDYDRSRRDWLFHNCPRSERDVTIALSARALYVASESGTSLTVQSQREQVSGGLAQVD